MLLWFLCVSFLWLAVLLYGRLAVVCVGGWQRFVREGGMGRWSLFACPKTQLWLVVSLTASTDAFGGVRLLRDDATPPPSSLAAYETYKLLPAVTEPYSEEVRRRIALHEHGIISL